MNQLDPEKRAQDPGRETEALPILGIELRANLIDAAEERAARSRIGRSHSGTGARRSAGPPRSRRIRLVGVIVSNFAAPQTIAPSELSIFAEAAL